MQADISGRIIDEKVIPIAGAVVSTAFGATITDVNGNFLFNGVAIDKDAGFIKVDKSGYFTGSRTMLVSANASITWK